MIRTGLRNMKFGMAAPVACDGSTTKRVYRFAMNMLMAVARVCCLYITFYSIVAPSYALQTEGSGQREGQMSVKATAASEVLTPRIVGGSLATDAYPWMTSLQVSGLGGRHSHLCGGVLVDVRTVLTAAHCVLEYTPRDLSVVIGELDLSQVSSSDRFAVAEVIVHPAYDRQSLANDLAVLRLTVPVLNGIPLSLPPLTGRQLGMALTDVELAALSGDVLLPGVYESNRFSETGVVYRILGWGATSAQANAPVVPHLLEADLEVFSPETCSNGLNGTTFCAGQLNGAVDSCSGDSGGPLLRVRTTAAVQELTEYELMGLVSYGNGEACGRPGVLGFYTDVQKFLAFIRGITTARDHWVPLRWLGLNYPVRAVVPINNYSDSTYFLELWSGDYPGGVRLSANDCEQAILRPGQGCLLTYQLAPLATGFQAISTPLPFAVTGSLGSAEAEKRLMGQVHVLPPLGATNAFRLPDVTWFSGGTDGAEGGASWIEDRATVAVGEASLRSPPLNDDESTVLQGYFEGSQQLEAYVLVDSEEGYDVLTVTVDGYEVYQASGYTQWQRLDISIPASGAVVRFDYVKDSADAPQAFSRDTAWVDFVSPSDNVVTDRFLVEPGELIEPLDRSSGGSMHWFVGVMMIVFGLWRTRVKDFRRRFSLIVSCIMFMGLVTGCAGNLSDDGGNSKHTQAQRDDSSGHQYSSNTQGVKPKPTAVAEPLYSKRFDGYRLTVQVRTFGCTQAKSFRLAESKDRPGWYTVERIEPDYCRRAPMIMTVNIPLPEYIARKIRDSDHPSQLKLTNIEVPSLGLPVIPPVVNP